jgi:hypothetical protein
MTLAILLFLTLVTALSFIGFLIQLRGVFSAGFPRVVRALIFLFFSAFMAIAVSAQWAAYLNPPP